MPCGEAAGGGWGLGFPARVMGVLAVHTSQICQEDWRAILERMAACLLPTSRVVTLLLASGVSSWTFRGRCSLPSLEDENGPRRTLPTEPRLGQLSLGHPLPWLPHFPFINQCAPLHWVASGIRLCACPFSRGLVGFSFSPVSTSLNVIYCLGGTVAWQLRKRAGLDDTSGVFAPVAL